MWNRFCQRNSQHSTVSCSHLLVWIKISTLAALGFQPFLLAYPASSYFFAHLPPAPLQFITTPAMVGGITWAVWHGSRREWAYECIYISGRMLVSLLDRPNDAQHWQTDAFWCRWYQCGTLVATPTAWPVLVSLPDIPRPAHVPRGRAFINMAGRLQETALQVNAGANLQGAGDPPCPLLYEGCKVATPELLRRQRFYLICRCCSCVSGPAVLCVTWPTLFGSAPLRIRSNALDE